ncbi:MAG: UPF0147 family protein [Methanosarcinales archaeon]|nr:UPF0147 family protein [Methanosarcinales archaeon]
MSNIEDTINQCIDALDFIMNDESVPRNIRRSADKVKNILLNKNETLSVQAATGISILEDMSNDPNIPMHTRTLIWNLASQLEAISIKDEN